MGMSACYKCNAGLGNCSSGFRMQIIFLLFHFKTKSYILFYDHGILNAYTSFRQWFQQGS